MTPALTNRMDTFTPSSAATPSVGSDWRMKLVVCAPVIGATLMSKFAIPPWGADGFGLNFPIIFAALLFGLVSGRLQLAWRRLLLFMVMLSVLGLVQVLRGDLFSLSSVILMAALGACYVFTAPESDGARGRGFDGEQALEFFRNLTFLIAAAGIVQAVVLRVGGQRLGFPIENYVPEAFLTQGFNNIIPLHYGSSTYKANGFVMLEPSVFSQLTAIGLIAELVGRARLLRLVVYTGAMIVAYSGTGLLILAVSLPAYVIIYRRWKLLLPGAFIVAALVLLAEPLQLSAIMNRTGEFGRTGSSGFARFVGWQELFADRLWNSPVHALFGRGAGSFMSQAAGYSAAQMSYSKIIFEFGVLGALLYFAFIFYCILFSHAPLLVRIAVSVCYFLNGAYSPTVTGLVLSLLLWPASQKPAAGEQIHPADQAGAGSKVARSRHAA
jgi:hypothetical protein